ncbi:phosphotransferase [Segnochrobactrum spirostomi]|uniref:Phosphotransferase n=1 Tax=Segnochrobactrum spirostomi TaxID=2608987 RepID=A0A6A7Y1M1_9HYPH|nr:phosphotransferase [Segnochrobactrum spirostomi]MQT12960.1 phosphotransferase [Segnochrobactrum spirostomi]
MESAPETPLLGGRVTAGVVRVGGTVRRPKSANSDFVSRLLLYLERRGFNAAPSFLGTDEKGRDVLSFIEGDVPAELGWHDDEALADAAVLIRNFHDIGEGFIPADAAPSGNAETVCHNDLSPCNFVFREGRPIALIDFDVAAPGARVDDLAYAAWLWLDLGSNDISPAEQRRRLALFVGAYGPVDQERLVPAILRRQALLIAEGKRKGDRPMVRWAEQCSHWTRRHLHTPR